MMYLQRTKFQFEAYVVNLLPNEKPMLTISSNKKECYFCYIKRAIFFVILFFCAGHVQSLRHLSINSVS